MCHALVTFVNTRGHRNMINTIFLCTKVEFFSRVFGVSSKMPSDSKSYFGFV